MLSSLLFEQKEAKLLFFALLRFLDQNQQNFAGAFLFRLIGDFRMLHKSHASKTIQKSIDNFEAETKASVTKLPKRNVKNKIILLCSYFLSHFVTYSLQCAF